MDFDKVVNSRRSVRNFSDKKPDWRQLIECVDAARHIPIAGKNFILRFIILQNREKIQKIANAAEQDFIGKARAMIIIYSDHSRLKTLFGDENGEKYARQEAGAAAQSILLAIEDRKLSGCWVGHYDEGQIKTILKIPDKMELEAVIPVGYEFKKYKTKPKEKISMDSILYFDEHKKKQMKAPFSPES